MYLTNTGWSGSGSGSGSGPEKFEVGSGFGSEINSFGTNILDIAINDIIISG